MDWDLVIFDCDGTLVDTEELSNGVVSDLLISVYGLPQYDLARCMEEFTGWFLEKIVADVIAKTGAVIDTDDFIARYESRLIDMIPVYIKAIEGVPEALSILQGQIKMRVASNGVRSVVLASLLHAGLMDFFTEASVYTKDMVKNGKPAPDLVLLAAYEAAVPPERALVVEDSVPGTLAGKAAGMKVIGLTAAYDDRETQHSRLRQAGADHVTERFADIPHLVGL